VLRLYRRLHQGLSLAFLAELRRPQQDGKVERSHRIDNEEFGGRHRFQDFEVAAAALRAWETRYNYERFSLALQGRTPAEKLAAFQPPQRAA
jgi:transposase InsO family protein